MVSSRNRVAPNTIPTAAKAGGNYLSSLLVGSEARRHGYQEGIALDTNGYISEGAGENLFEVKTASFSLRHSPLPRCRASLATPLSSWRKMRALKYASRYCRVSPSTADEVFMSGTAAEITPVRSVDGIRSAKANAGRSPNVFSRPSLACSPVKPKINGAG